MEVNRKRKAKAIKIRSRLRLLTLKAFAPSAGGIQALDIPVRRPASNARITDRNNPDRVKQAYKCGYIEAR